MLLPYFLFSGRNGDAKTIWVPHFWVLWFVRAAVILNFFGVLHAPKRYRMRAITYE